MAGRGGVRAVDFNQWLPTCSASRAQWRRAGRAQWRPRPRGAGPDARRRLSPSPNSRARSGVLVSCREATSQRSSTVAGRQVQLRARRRITESSHHAHDCHFRHAGACRHDAVSASRALPEAVISSQALSTSQPAGCLCLAAGATLLGSCRQMRHVLRYGVALQPFDAALATEATVLHAAERRLRTRCNEVVDRQITDLHPFGQAIDIAC
jgi:hypothetical protein